MIQAEHGELFRKVLRENRNFVLTTHMNPDGDALGSQIGLTRFLIGRGCRVRIINQDSVPRQLEFLLDDEIEIEVYDPGIHDRVIEETDRVILLDNSAPDRLGRMERCMRSFSGKTLCIDHHPTRRTLWGDNIIYREACATAALIYQLVIENGWQPDIRAAEALYIGLATDTGFFRFNSTNVQAHAFAAELLALGVDPARCFRETQERNSPEYTRLLGAVLTDLRLDAGGVIASARITLDMMERFDAEGVDTSEMTTPLLAIDGVRIALLFRALPDGKTKVSVRSKGTLDVYSLALQFGGGGHRNASGIVTDGDMETVMEQVIARAVEVVGD